MQVEGDVFIVIAIISIWKTKILKGKDKILKFRWK